MNRSVLELALKLPVLIAIVLVAQQTAHAQQATDPRVADLIQTGKLRVGLGVVAPHWAVRDSATGELRGVSFDIARALATRLGLELVVVEYSSPSRIPDGLKVGAWDVAFMGVDPSRAAVVDFAPPHMQVDATFLVPADSPIRNIADADQPGVRIAVTRKGIEEIVLSRTMKRAELRAVERNTIGFDLLRAGDVEVLAAPRPALRQFSARLPGSRVLEDRFHSTFGAMAVPKGQVGRLAYVSEFIEEAKASGLVRRAIERADLRGVVQLAPAGYPGTQ